MAARNTKSLLGDAPSAVQLPSTGHTQATYAPAPARPAMGAPQSSTAQSAYIGTSHDFATPWRLQSESTRLEDVTAGHVSRLADGGPNAVEAARRIAASTNSTASSSSSTPNWPPTAAAEGAYRAASSSIYQPVLPTPAPASATAAAPVYYAELQPPQSSSTATGHYTPQPGLIPNAAAGSAVAHYYSLTDAWRQQHQERFGLAFAPVRTAQPPAGNNGLAEVSRKRPLVASPPPTASVQISGDAAAIPFSKPTEYNNGNYTQPGVDESKPFRPMAEITPQVVGTTWKSATSSSSSATLPGGVGTLGRYGADIPSPLDSEINYTILEMQQELAFVESLPDNDKLRHSKRLLKEQCLKLEQAIDPDWLEVDIDKPIRVCKRVLIPSFRHPNFNYVGRVLGTKGQTLQNICRKFKCHISIMGEGSTKDRQKEIEMLNSGDPRFVHYASPLHIRIDTVAPAHIAHMRIAGALHVLHKLLIPGREHIEGITEKFPSDPNQPNNKTSWRNNPPYMEEEKWEADELERQFDYGDNNQLDKSSDGPPQQPVSTHMGKRKDSGSASAGISTPAAEIGGSSNVSRGGRGGGYVPKLSRKLEG